MTTQAQRLRRRRKARQDLSQFAALIETPGTGTVVIPADGMFALRAPAAHAAGNALTVTGPTNRTIGVPALAENDFHLIGKLERGTTVALQSWIDLYVHAGLGGYRKICDGS
jgi:hypothetical protein